MKSRLLFVLVGALALAHVSAHASDAYFHSPAEKIMCTIRAQNADGSRDAVGTDITNPHTFIMETIRVDANGLSQKSWVIDRETRNTREGGYNVFRTHCAPLMKTVPPEVSDLFTEFFAN